MTSREGRDFGSKTGTGGGMASEGAMARQRRKRIGEIMAADLKDDPVGICDMFGVAAREDGVLI